MNWLDIVFICLAVVGFIKGYLDGFVRQVVMFFALIAGIYFCSKIAVSLREYIMQIGWFPEYSVTILSYVVAFILIVGVIMGAGGIMQKMMDITPLHFLNHLAGGSFALVATVFLFSLILNMLEELDRHSVIISYDTKVESRFYFYVREIMPAVYPADLFVWRK